MSETLGWTSYVDTKAQVELDRLRLMESVFDPLSARLLDRVGIKPGWQCLEVGAGAGSIARMLADRAGAANVTATDLATDFLAPLAETGIQVLHHDVTVDDPPGEFDVIHSRFVLEHVTRRHDAVRRMASWLKPGGWLLVESALPMPEQSTEPVVARALAAMAAQFATSVGTDPEWARSLPLPLEAAGLAACGSEGSVVPARGGSRFARFLVAGHRLVEKPAVAAGLLSEREFADAYARYADPSFIDYNWMIIAAWGRRETS
jgi:SAM-dependent methyltransferase